MRRTEIGQVLTLGDELSHRERMVVDAVARLKLATHGQLASLMVEEDTHTTADSRARSVRRILARLTNAGLLSRLDRRIGGMRAGSAGFVYYLGPVGQRLVAFWNGLGATRGRRRPDPGDRFVQHRLAVSELYVQAQTVARAGRLRLVDFDVEPECWCTYVDRSGREVILKPDAVVHVSAPGETRRIFVEVDLGTESRPVVARKLRTYREFFVATETEAPRSLARPRVLLLAPTPARQAALEGICAALPSPQREQCIVDALDRGPDALSAIAACRPR